MLNVAEPPDSATGEPELVPSTANWTVPVGVPAVEVTVAVNVTESPNIDGFADDDTLIVVDAPLTVCVNEPVLELKVVPSLYDAVIE